MRLDAVSLKKAPKTRNQRRYN